MHRHEYVQITTHTGMKKERERVHFSISFLKQETI